MILSIMQKDILMVEDENVILEYENQKLEVNFKLFSIAIKKFDLIMV